MEIPAAFIDTAVVVDLLRGYPPAQVWYSTQQDLGVCRSVWMEVLEGATNKHDQQNAIKLLQSFILVTQPDEDIEWAVQSLRKFKLSHNVDAFDCLIAAATHRLNVTLYTRNMKHFSPLLGKLAAKPY
jgi:predicted nucleic acid-binding protein